MLASRISASRRPWYRTSWCKSCSWARLAVNVVILGVGNAWSHRISSLFFGRGTTLNASALRLSEEKKNTLIETPLAIKLFIDDIMSSFKSAFANFSDLNLVQELDSTTR